MKKKKLPPTEPIEEQILDAIKDDGGLYHFWDHMRDPDEWDGNEDQFEDEMNRQADNQLLELIRFIREFKPIP